MQTRDHNADCVLTAFADNQLLKLVAPRGRNDASNSAHWSLQVGTATLCI